MIHTAALVDHTFITASRALGCALLLVTGMRAETGAGPKTLLLEGATFAARGFPEGCQVIDGPRADQAGVVSLTGAKNVQARLASEMGARGAVAFWFRPDRAYRSGAGQPAVQEKLLELDHLLSISFTADASAVSVTAEWLHDRGVNAERDVRILLPELPGPGWHHFALSWDAGVGDINAYIDGSPYYVPGQRTPPWTVTHAKEMNVRIGRIGIAHIRIDDAPLDAEWLRDELGPATYRRLDWLLGAAALTPFDAGEQKGKLLWTCRLGSAEDTQGWTMEGLGKIAFVEGWTLMDSERPDGPEGHVVYWAPPLLADRFCAEWEFKLRAEKGLCIVFFSARGRSGQDLFDPSLRRRAGVFSEYTKGDIDCYHISYFANAPSTPRVVANLRKNHGFHLLSNGPVGVARPVPGEIHRAVLVKDGPWIRMSVDGRTIIDYHDDAGRAGTPLGAGRFGLRQMQWTSAAYRNLRIYALKN